MKTTGRGEHGDLHRPEAERERVDEPGQERDRGNEEDGHLRRRRQGDLARERDLPAVRDDDRPAVLGRVPDDRDDDGGDEELREPGLLREHLERADEDLGDERGRDGRDRERPEGGAERPAEDLLVARDVQPLVAAQRVHRHGDVDEQQHDRDRHRELASESRSGSPSQPGIAGMRNISVANASSPNAMKLE